MPPSQKNGRAVGFKLTITVSIAVSVSMLVIISLATVIFLQWQASRKNTTEMMGAVSWLILEFMEQGIASHLQPTADQLEVIANEFTDGRYDLNDRPAMLKAFRNSVSGLPQIASLGFIDTDAHGLGVRWEDGERAAIDASFASRPDIVEIVNIAGKSKQPFWGPLVFSENRVLVNRLHPIYAKGVYKGVLFSAVTVDHLSDLVGDLGDVFDTTAFVLYGKDHVLAHPNLQSFHPDQSVETPLVKLGRAGDPIMAEIWRGRDFPLIEARDESLGIREVSFGNENYVIIYRKIQKFGDQPLYVGAWFEIARIDQAFQRLKTSLFFSLALFAVSIIAAVILGRVVGRPIRRLARSAMQIGELKIDNVERLPASRISELDEQSRAFNAMLSSLKAFETYVPRTLVERLLNRGEAETMISEERELTIMFTDIAGFTSMSENMPAQEVADFLNEHLALLGTCVEQQDGTIDKFIGDALMAFWGAPDVQGDTTHRACRAAMAMKQAIEQDNVKRKNNGLAAIRVRVGIHVGPVIVGNVGWPGRINYTIVGDAVNACQRLEALGKEFDIGEDVTVLVSGQAVQRVEGHFPLTHVGSRQVKGKQEPLDVYRLSAD